MPLDWWFPEFLNAWEVCAAVVDSKSLSADLDNIGEGRLITICDTDSPPPYPVMANMNFKPSIVSGVLASLNWATSEEDYTPRKSLHLSGFQCIDLWPVIPPSDIPVDQIRSERQKSRLNKRKAVSDLLTSTRDELFAGEFDAFVFLRLLYCKQLFISSSYSLIIASEYEPYSIVDKLVPYLGGSASIVVQSPHVQVCFDVSIPIHGFDCYLQILADLQNRMRVLPQYLCPTVTEAWLRRYQVFIPIPVPHSQLTSSRSYLVGLIRQ
jgi:tRNA (adenine-N(1)-)-methyltransferase non-catalytic subunit